MNFLSSDHEEETDKKCIDLWKVQGVVLWVQHKSFFRIRGNFPEEVILEQSVKTSRVGRRAAEVEGRACAKAGRQRLRPDLVVQRLRLRASIPGGLVQSQVRELRSCKHDLVNHRVECLGDLLCVGTRQEGVRLRSQAGVRSPKPLGVKQRHLNSTCSLQSH